MNKDIYTYDGLLKELTKKKETPMEVFTKACAYIVLGFIMLAVLALLVAYPTKWCWNASIAPIFHLQEIDALQAWCLCWCGGMFFKGTNPTPTRKEN